MDEESPCAGVAPQLRSVLVPRMAECTREGMGYVGPTERVPVRAIVVMGARNNQSLRGSIGQRASPSG